jgi:transposase-like protein
MSKRAASPYRNRNRWTAEDARDVLAALEASGLSVAAFALREGLDPQRLYWWRRRQAITRSERMPAPAFVELAATGGSDLIEVALRSGRVLRISSGIDPARLRRIAEALEEDGSC